MDHITYIKFKQQINTIENNVFELRKLLEQSEVYNSDSKIYNVIDGMISDVLSQTSAMRKTVKSSGSQRLLKG